ncbi:MAG: hypothetical protein ACXV39_10745 [Halobacteriota archaeon]
MAQFKNKSNSNEVIDAFEWMPGAPVMDTPDWFFMACEARDAYPEFDGTCVLNMNKERSIAQEGDYIVQDGNGKLCSYKPDVFEATYEFCDEE